MTRAVVVDVIQNLEYPDHIWFSASIEMWGRKFMEVDSTEEGAIESLRKVINYHGRIQEMGKPDGFPKLVEVDL